MYMFDPTAVNECPDLPPGVAGWPLTPPIEDIEVHINFWTIAIEFYCSWDVITGVQTA